MKATKNLNGAARAAVQAKLSAVEKELRKARDLVQLRTEELGRVRATVRQHALENEELRDQLAKEQAKLAAADNELRAARATIEALEMELYEAKDLIQRYKATAQRSHNAARLMYAAWTGLAIAAFVYGFVL